MPELPEVETIRKQLQERIVGKKLNGKRITAVRRRAKLLIIDFVDGSSLVFHLKLTGQLLFNAQPSRYTRKVFVFDDGAQLVFNDLRKFGWWKKVKSFKEIEEKLGPEPLTLTLTVFRSRLVKRPKAKIKPLLMDQRFIAGIGNIYADEILFASQVQPIRRAGGLSLVEIKAIFQNIKKVLKAAIKAHGSSSQHYLDARGKKGQYVRYHKVYRRTGQKCPRCASLIRRIKMGGRSAHFCPQCQK